MSFLKKAAQLVSIGPLAGKPGSGVGASKLLNLIIPVVPTVSHSEVVSGAGGGQVDNQVLPIPLPVLSQVSAGATPSDPDFVYQHDDDTLVDTDITAVAISAPTIADGYNANGTVQQDFSGVNWGFQTFVAGGNYTAAVIRLYIYGSVAGIITASIKAVDVSHKPTGADLISTTYDSTYTDLVSPGSYIDFGLGAGLALTMGTEYAIVWRIATGTFLVTYDSAHGYAGVAGTSTNSGSTWTIHTWSFLFQILTTNTLDTIPFPTPPSVGDGLYIGKSTQFDYVTVWNNQQGVGNYAITLKYYNGASWIALVLLGAGDQPNSYKITGQRVWTFGKPADWATFTVDGHTVYWVKAEVTGFVTMTTIPALGNVKIGAY